MQQMIVLPCLVAALTACTTPVATTSGAPRAPQIVLGDSVAPTAAPLPPPVAARGASSVAGAHGDAVALELWNDPAFRRAFALSYLAETDIEPRVTALEREELQAVLELLAADRLDEAAKLLQKRDAGTTSAVFDFTLANIHFQQERLEPAAAAFRVAIEKFPKFRRAWRNLALIHVRQGAFAPAVEAFTRVIELGGGDALTYGLLGFAYSNLEQHLPAESAYRMANLLDPQTMDWKMGLARSFFRQGRFADSVALCGSLIAAEPERADLWLLQANAYLGLEQPRRAAENFELVERLGHSSVDSLNMLADIYVNEELYDLAVDGYLRALERDPAAEPERAIRAAKVLTARGALDETRRLLARIEELRGPELKAGERKDLLKLRARLAVAGGAGDEEARVLEEIVALDPLDGEALLLLGQHANRAGDPERAVFYFERAASLEAFEADAKVRHAQLLVGLGRYGEALPLLRRAQELQPRENIQQYMEQVERVAQTR